MSKRALSDHQREILDALADQGELLRWCCGDRVYRWHVGDGEVDGRAVRGLVRRGLLELGGDWDLGQLVLTASGREALR
jgi:hypothetical protein